MIRRAEPDDAPAMHEVAKRASIRAYGDFIDPATMLATLDERGPERFRTALADATTEGFVLEVDGRIAGYAIVLPARRSEDAELGELASLYVDPPAQGAGVGTALLARAEEALRERGFTEAMARVYADNGHGRAFYERRGWTTDGRAFAEDGWWAPAVVYRRTL